MHPREGGDRLVFDNGRGGTGRMFDWRVIDDHPRLGSALVAGGIGADNARDAMRLGADELGERALGCRKRLFD